MTTRAMGWMLAAAFALVACGGESGSGSVAPANRTLSVQKGGEGSGVVRGGEIYCGATCTASLAEGAVATVAAIPDGDSTFAGWIGCDSIEGVGCTVTMIGDRTVTAAFDPIENVLR